MKKITTAPYRVNSIYELHRLLALPKPEHPLVSVIDLGQTEYNREEGLQTVIYNFYSVCIKKDFKGKLKYGQHYYDFDEGMMTFFSPGQVIATEINDGVELSGLWLVVHPDFLRNYPLAKTITEYGYFSYAVNEALHLSEKEESMVISIMQNIQQEYRCVIDSYSQSVIISQIELLLNYCDRFYNRQFITRKNANNDLLTKLEKLLADHFNNTKAEALPTVKYLSEQLHISPNYLSDMLRLLTGQSTQQHIHNKLIEKAKEILTGTRLSVSEIAFQLGFEHPQSFSKFFKNKTNVSPGEFRQSFN